MRNRTVLAVSALLALLGACGKGGQKDREKTPIDKIPVNEAVIKLRDLEVSGSWLRNWCVSQELALRASGPLVPDEHSMIKAGMKILTKILLLSSEAERRGLAVDPSEIEARLSKEMSQFPSTEEWLRRLEVSGSSREKRREEIRRELLVEKYEQEILRPEVSGTLASAERAREFFERFPEKFVRPNTVHAYAIIRTFAKDAPETERQREKTAADKARQRVLAGESFEDVARETSTHPSASKGGDFGVLTDQMAMEPAFKQVLFSLAPGKVSEVIESQLGYAVFSIKDKEPSRPMTFEEVREEIQANLLRDGLKRAIERTAQDLQAQAMAKNELQWLDLKPFIGDPPPPSENAASGADGTAQPAAAQP